MLLLLLYGLHSDVLAWFPVDVAASAFKDLRSLERERLVAVDLAAQEVFLAEDSVGEVVVRRKVELQGVAQILIVLDFDVRKLLKEWFIVRLDHIAKQVSVAEDRQPEVGNS